MTARERLVRLNGSVVSAQAGETILQVARRLGVEIPTLCHDPRIAPDSSCSVCLVQIQDGGTWRMHSSCSTEVEDQMVVRTESPDIFAARRWALELLLSDHYADCVAPCVTECPTHVDVPAYVAAVRDGRNAEAVEIIRRTNPLPGVCGRVCPHVCETVCRRTTFDESLSINALKRAATAGPPPPAPPIATTGAGQKTVAIVGAGPAGLSAAYYLRLAGHDVTVFDSQEKAGGMLRYGIPEFRLPREILDGDIAVIEQLGVRFEHDQRLGRDFTVAELVDSGHDAVFLALGAWKGRALEIPNEDVEGVLGGVEFLKRVNQGATDSVCGRVGVVGGGNTALDAARAALRLGASEVTILYRRSRDHMPAFVSELEAAVAEGVALMCLVSPVAVEVDAGKLSGVRLQRMIMGAADHSGRPRPLAIPGSEFSVELDLLISAVGEQPDLSSLDDPDSAARPGPVNQVNADTLSTNADGVFAGGDFVTGPSSAVEAIAAGRRAAISIDNYLREGIAQHPCPPVYSRRDNLAEPEEADFCHVASRPRAPTPERPVHERTHDFAEVELGYSEQTARLEADRCMECSCSTFEVCDLRPLMATYQVQQGRVKGAVHRYAPGPLRPGILLEMNKCIRCSRCVGICREVAGVAAIDFIFRGFDTRLIFAPSPTAAIFERCDACLASGALCVDTCPTGALTVVNSEAKLAVPETDRREMTGT